MKSRFISNVLILPLAVVSMLATSCGKDDDNTPTPPDRNVAGIYEGKSRILQVVPQEESEGTSEWFDVAARSTADSICFDEFPVKPIIENILGEGNADGIMEALGKVSHRTYYTQTPGKDGGSTTLELTPDPLTITLPGTSEDDPGLTIEVSVIAINKGQYTYEGKKLGFTLDVESVTVNGTPLGAPLFTPFSIGFDLNKK